MTAWCHLPTIFNRRHVLRSAGLLALCAALITTLLLTHVSHAAAGTNRTITFQGRLLAASGAVVPDGHYNIQFKIYQDGSGTAAGNPDGTLKWTESYVNNNSNSGIEVTNGFFSVSLGSLNPFGTSVDWSQNTLWLSMNVAGSASSCTTFGGTNCSPDGEMLPMRQITATPYAINSGAVGGKTVDQLIQNTTSPQANSNIALQSGSDTDVTALIQGRSSQTAANLVIKQGTSQTGKALDVQNSSGGSYFNIDSTGTLNQTGNAVISGNLGVGTAAPSRPLDVATSSSSTNALPVRIAQNGTGNAGIEMSTTSSSKYAIGIDSSDGSFKVASSIAGGATAALGATNLGSTDGTGNYQHVQANKYTAAEGGPVMNMSVYLSAVDSYCPGIQLGVYADNNGTPGALLGSSTKSNATTGWNTKNLSSSVTITSGTVYWLALFTDCDDTTKAIPGGGTSAHMSSMSALPNTFASQLNGTTTISMYATIDTSAGVANTFGGSATILNLGPTGQATFKNSVDSQSAFQVQDSSGSDLLSVNTTASSGAKNVQVGTGSGSGTPTLLTLDKASTPPTVQNQSALLGSMYYDTTLGKVQCYEAAGWGSCGASPDTFVTISPEYTNAVMNGTDIGTITSDLCSGTLNINNGTNSQPNICGANETHNFYKWTSAETTSQTRSIFVTYQLSSTFKNFVAGSTSLLGRTDSADSSVSYQIYKDNGSGLTSCGSAVSVSTGAQTSWQKAVASGSADPSTCSFSPGNSILLRINLTAKNNANAYVSNLGFTFNNN